MKFYSFLLLLIITFVIGCESAAVVTANLHDSAVLPCSKTCSGSVTWFVSDDTNDLVAVCDQVLCESKKEGYQMNHNQYLKGDFSLTIIKANFSHRDAYKSRCGLRDLCKVVLQVIETPSLPGWVTPVVVLLVLVVVALLVVLLLVVRGQKRKFLHSSSSGM